MDELLQDRALNGACERILEWMAGKLPPGGECPVLLSDMKREMGPRFRQEAFDDLVKHGVIRAEFPEAKRGDSGRQFWNFAHWSSRANPSLDGER